MTDNSKIKSVTWWIQLSKPPGLNGHWNATIPLPVVDRINRIFEENGVAAVVEIFPTGQVHEMNTETLKPWDLGFIEGVLAMAGVVGVRKDEPEKPLAGAMLWVKPKTGADQIPIMALAGIINAFNDNELPADVSLQPTPGRGHLIIIGSNEECVLRQIRQILSRLNVRIIEKQPLTGDPNNIG